MKHRPTDPRIQALIDQNRANHIAAYRRGIAALTELCAPTMNAASADSLPGWAEVHVQRYTTFCDALERLDKGLRGIFGLKGCLYGVAGCPPEVLFNCQGCVEAADDRARRERGAA